MVLERARRGLFLYRRLYVQRLKSVLEYKSDFWILMIAGALVQGLGFVFIWALFLQIPDIHGWGMWDIVLMYALIFFTEGVGSLFFEGTWMMSRLVNRGEFDQILVRPASPVVQMLTSDVGMNGLGNIVLGGFLISQALIHGDVALTPLRALVAAVLFASAIAIRIAIHLAANSIAFWTREPNNSFALMVHNFGDFGKYPITIYSLWLRPLIIAAIPFAFVGFFPAAYLFERGGWAQAALLAPIVAVYAVALSLWIFRSGLARYESAGT